MKILLNCHCCHEYCVLTPTMFDSISRAWRCMVRQWEWRTCSHLTRETLFFWLCCINYIAHFGTVSIIDMHRCSTFVWCLVLFVAKKRNADHPMIDPPISTLGYHSLAVESGIAHTFLPSVNPPHSRWVTAHPLNHGGHFVGCYSLGNGEKTDQALSPTRFFCDMWQLSDSWHARTRVITTLLFDGRRYDTTMS